MIYENLIVTYVNMSRARVSTLPGECRKKETVAYAVEPANNIAGPGGERVIEI